MWLLINVYKPPSVSDSAFCEKISGTIDFYSQKYKNIVLMGDFNMQPTDNNFQTFCESHDLYNLIKDKTFFKTIEGTCIDLILTNQKRSFKNTCTMETGISDFQASNMQTANVNKNNFWKTIGPFFSNKSVKQAKKTNNYRTK